MEEKTAEATTTSNVVSSLAEKPFEDTQKSSKGKLILNLNFADTLAWGHCTNICKNFPKI